MNTWLTSDLHLGHSGIIKYCNRPFKDEQQMNETLIRNWNQRIKKDDVVYHLGDFCFRGGIEGGTNKAKYWEDQLNGKIIHIKGNHDPQNSVKSILKVALLEFGNKVVLAKHEPPLMKLEVPEFCDFVLCGHVHEKWKYIWLSDTNDTIPIINVGVDIWNFRPVRLDEILVFYDKIMKEKRK
ncbi:MAG: metallophosphoesterase [Candidatus Pacearchaeota archaeon]